MCKTDLNYFFEKRSPIFWAVFSSLTVGLFCWIDSHTSYEFEFSTIYLIPISLVTWYTRLRCGVVHSIGCMILSAYIDISTGHFYSSMYYFFGNAIIQGALFIATSVLIDELRRSFKRNEHLASIDSLTGAYNSRMFRLFLQMEIDRFNRSHKPFTIVLFDVDNFKRVNDVYGHPTGDRVLCYIVNQIKKFLRKTDIISRIGGDEFVLLLPSTDQNASQVIVSKIIENIRAQSSNCPISITVSAGALTCVEGHLDPDKIISTADALQYKIKHSSKNSVQFSFYPYSPNSRGDMQQ